MASHIDSGKPTNPAHLVLEAWSQGMMVGSLIVMAMITTANMRAGVLLHKLVLLELIIAVPNAFFIFLSPPAFGWYLSSTAVLLIGSWGLHNVIAWIKNKPFLNRPSSRIYIGTVALAQVYWVVEIYANFTYFNGINEHLFVKTRPYEALFRDPWWLFTTVNLFWNIRHRYSFGLLAIIRVSPRFGILLLSMCLSLAFIVVDILSVTAVLDTGAINPFWKFSFVFKCFTDTIILDDFKTALDRLWQHERQLMRLQGRVTNNTPAFEQLEFGGQDEFRREVSEGPLEMKAVYLVGVRQERVRKTSDGFMV